MDMERTPNRTRRIHAPAFTLIEMLIVMGLLVLLAAISWPHIAGRMTAAELPESAERLRDALFLARTEAAMQHRRVRVRFQPDQQQPKIEYEPDPVEYPDAWEEIKASWWAGDMRDGLLLGDVQVHEIRIGRPAYLRPLGLDEDPRQLLEEAEDEQEQAMELDDASILAEMEQSEEEFDEHRPWIIFEPDGSTEWATFVLATIPLEEPLDEKLRQVWVILDGRTGQASVKDMVTEEQMMDPEFYIPREKLELPDQVEIDALAFKIGSTDQFGSSGNPGNMLTGELGGLDELGDASDSGADGEGSELDDGSTDALADDGSGLGQSGGRLPDGRDFGNTGRRGGNSSVGQAGAGDGVEVRRPGRGGQGRRPGGNRVSDRVPQSEDDAGSGDPQIDALMRELEGTDLTEEERRNIIQALREGS